MSGDTLENKRYFYDTYAQKLQNTAPAVYGIYYHIETQVNDNESRTKHMFVASNRDKEMEYRIILTPDEKEQYMMQDFSENKMFAIDASEHGICTIVYRTKNTQDTVQTIEVR